MLPTFFGLNAVTRALMAQQEAVDVVNQNISNASTPGYSRQQAVISTFDPYAPPAFDRPALAGQLGTGTTVSSVNRFADEMLNSQIRTGMQSSGQLDTMDAFYTQIQAILNDSSTQGVNTASTNFFNAVHALANNPEASDARTGLQQTGATLASTISSSYQQLTSLQQDLNGKVQSLVTDVNSTLTQIATLNNQIAQVRGTGDNANDLMDKRDTLVDHLSGLIDTRVVKNPDGTDTIQMNGRFLVNKDQAYTLTTLTDASSGGLVKPVKVFWQQDVTKFQNLHPGYDPITGKNVTTGAPLVAGTDAPPLSVAPATLTTGSLAGAMQIRDDVIQNTLLPQLNELADSLTNTQVLSSVTGLKATQALTGGNGAAADNFVVSVLTSQGAPTPPGPGQLATFALNSVTPPAATVQDVVDAINSSTVAGLVHASLNSAGQLQIDTIAPGALVKVDQANGAASRDFGFSPTVADGFNFIQAQGYGLHTQPQFTGGISGLTLATTIQAGDTLTVTGPDGAAMAITVPPPVPTTVPPSTMNTVADLIDTINAKGLSHGFQAALDSAGHLLIFSSPTVYGPNGQQAGAPAQVTGNNTTASISGATTLTTGSQLSVTGPGGSVTFTATAGSTVANLLSAINNANIGLTASVNSVGQFQLATQANGSGQSVNITAATGDMTSVLGLSTGVTKGLDRGYPPSASVTVSTTSANAEQDFYGGGILPAPVTVTNANQLFFQGAGQQLSTQVIGATSTAGPFNIVQPRAPGQLSVAIFGSGVTYAPGAQVAVTGVDAKTGATVTENVLFSQNGVQTTTHFFQSIASVVVSGVTGGQLQVVNQIASTQNDTAGAMAVDPAVLKDPSLIAASNTPEAPGNQANALALLNVQQQATVGNGLVATSIGNFYAQMINALGNAASETHTSRTTQDQLVLHIQNQKQSVVGVSLDEEAATLVALQHTYEAAARAITTQDSMLNTIINNMGLALVP